MGNPEYSLGSNILYKRTNQDLENKGLEIQMIREHAWREAEDKETYYEISLSSHQYILLSDVIGVISLAFIEIVGSYFGFQFPKWLQEVEEENQRMSGSLGKARLQ